MTQKLLILNGSHSEIPLIKAAKKLGFYVITSGNNKNGIGHKYADEYHAVDFSNKNDILSLAQKLKIDRICSAAHDLSLISASYACEKLGIPGHDNYETTLTLHQKDLFKKFAVPLGISTPSTTSYTDIDKALSSIDKHPYPIIIKPIDLGGGKGVSKALKKEDYETAVKHAFETSKSKRIVVEEFIEGTQHSLTTFILKNKVVFYFSDNEHSYLNPYLVSTSAGPATNIDKVINKLIDDSEKIASQLSLCDGIFHMQYLMKDNIPYIIEITRRCSGDIYPEPVKYSTGVAWAKWIVKAETGMDCSSFPKKCHPKIFLWTTLHNEP